MGRPSLDVIEDFDSEEEEERQIIAEKVKTALGKKMEETAIEAEAEKDNKAIEIAMKGGATREQAIEELAASKATVESEEASAIAPAAPAAPTIIQTILDSLLRRLIEEEEARKAAGLSAFKATGNPLADGFRKMLEKKMMETFKQEMRVKELEELENRRLMAN